MTSLGYEKDISNRNKEVILPLYIVLSRILPCPFLLFQEILDIEYGLYQGSKEECQKLLRDWNNGLRFKI